MAKTPLNLPAKDTNTLSTAVSSVINEEKEKSKRKLNLIVHNLSESSKESGDDRKQEDIAVTTKLLDKYMEIPAKVVKAFRIGQRKDKPRLLKITVSTEQEKAEILWNCTKLRNSNNPNDVKKIFIAPDLTPLEQTANRKLREELKRKEQKWKPFSHKTGSNSTVEIIHDTDFPITNSPVIDNCNFHLNLQLNKPIILVCYY